MYLSTFKRNWILHYIKPEFLYLPRGKRGHIEEGEIIIPKKKGYKPIILRYITPYHQIFFNFMDPTINVSFYIKKTNINTGDVSYLLVTNKEEIEITEGVKIDDKVVPVKRTVDSGKATDQGEWHASSVSYKTSESPYDFVLYVPDDEDCVFDYLERKSTYTIVITGLERFTPSYKDVQIIELPHDPAYVEFQNPNHRISDTFRPELVQQSYIISQDTEGLYYQISQNFNSTIRVKELNDTSGSSDIDMTFTWIPEKYTISDSPIEEYLLTHSIKCAYYYNSVPTRLVGGISSTITSTLNWPKITGLNPQEITLTEYNFPQPYGCGKVGHLQKEVITSVSPVTYNDTVTDIAQNSHFIYDTLSYKSNNENLPAGYIQLNTDIGYCYEAHNKVYTYNVLGGFDQESETFFNLNAAESYSYLELINDSSYTKPLLHSIDINNTSYEITYNIQGMTNFSFNSSSPANEQQRSASAIIYCNGRYNPAVAPDAEYPHWPEYLHYCTLSDHTLNTLNSFEVTNPPAPTADNLIGYANGQAWIGTVTTGNSREEYLLGNSPDYWYRSERGIYKDSSDPDPKWYLWHNSDNSFNTNLFFGYWLENAMVDGNDQRGKYKKKQVQEWDLTNGTIDTYYGEGIDGTLINGNRIYRATMTETYNWIAFREAGPKTSFFSTSRIPTVNVIEETGYYNNMDNAHYQDYNESFNTFVNPTIPTVTQLHLHQKMQARLINETLAYIDNLNSQLQQNPNASFNEMEEFCLALDGQRYSISYPISRDDDNAFAQMAWNTPFIYRAFYSTTNGAARNLPL